MNLKEKPYPKHFGHINKILHNNKGYWLEDLTEEMDNFNSFTKKTFMSINEFKQRYADRYGIKTHKAIISPKEKNAYNNDDFDEIIDEQY